MTGRSRLCLLMVLGFVFPYCQKSGAASPLLMLDHGPSFGQREPVCQDSDDEKSESGSETKTTECEKQPTPQLACSR